MRNRAASPACADGKNNGLRNLFDRCPGSTGLSSHLAGILSGYRAETPDITLSSLKRAGISV